jgi:hypothetical protein
VRRGQPVEVFFEISVTVAVAVVVVAGRELIGAKSDFPEIRDAVLVGVQQERAGRLRKLSRVVNCLDFSAGKGALVYLYFIH